METIVEMDQKIKIESVDSDCLAELKEETFVKVENYPDVCVPKLETYESALLEDPLNISNDAQGLLCKSEIKSEASDIDEYYSETPICPPIKTEQDSFAIIPVGIIPGADKPFQCPKCSIRFKHKTSLETHVACVHEGKKFIPEVVLDNKSKDPSNVSTGDEQVFQCQKNVSENCSEIVIKTEQNSLVINPVSTNSGADRSFQCDQCNKQYSHKSHLNQHIASVHDGKKHECDHCKKQFSHRSSLKVHIDAVHEGTKFDCDMCDKTFTQKNSLKIHIKTVHEKKRPFACEICGKSFQDKNGMKRHLRLVHKNQSNVSTEDKQVFQCQNCDNNYKHKWSLKVHVGTVHEGRKFGCDQCNKQFSQKCHLNLHIDTVHEGKKFDCDQCNKQFSQKCHLNEHIAIVHEGKKFDCDQCIKQFSYKVDLNQHIANVHDGKNYECDQCNKQLSNKNSLKTHIDTVHEGKRPVFPCDQCDNQYLRKDYLNQHISSVHDGKRSECDQCNKQLSDKSSLKRHVTAFHEGMALKTESQSFNVHKNVKKKKLTNIFLKIDTSDYVENDIRNKPDSFKSELKEDGIKKSKDPSDVQKYKKQIINKNSH